MKKWECPCGYIYDPEEGSYENGVEPGTSWEDICQTIGSAPSAALKKRTSGKPDFSTKVLANLPYCA